MRTALYVQDGLEQVVLTPETETEKRILALLHDKSRKLEIKKGSFFQCQGGWLRHGVHQVRETPYGFSTESGDESTMLVLRPGDELA